MHVTKWNFITATLILALPLGNVWADESDEETSESSDDSSDNDSESEEKDQPSTEEDSSDADNSDADSSDVDELTPIQIGGWVQTRFRFDSLEGGDKRKNQGAFSIPRAKLVLTGTPHSSKIQYRFQAEFGLNRIILDDFYVDYRPGEGEMRIRAGQFKLPFSRQQLASTAELSMVDRTIVDLAFGNGRDIGFEIHNGLGERDGLEWAVGMFNGTGTTGVFGGELSLDPVTGETVSSGEASNIPDQLRPAAVARIGYNSGITGYSEPDLEGGPQRYAVALALMYHGTGGPNGAIGRVGADFVLKDKGLAVTGGVYASAEAPKAADLSYASLGGYAQLGFVLNKKWEPALRYALVSKDGGDKQHEVIAGVSLFDFGHSFKLQSDATLRINDVNDVSTKDFQLRTQLQLVF